MIHSAVPLGLIRRRKRPGVETPGYCQAVPVGQTQSSKNGLVAGAGGVTVAADMKTLPGKRKVSGLTLIELVVMIAVIVIIAAVLLPSGGTHKRATGAVCMNNQKQIAIALIMFQDDHNGKFPWQESTTNGGSIEFVTSNQTAFHFRALSGYLSKRTDFFVCPTDSTRQPAASFAEMTNTNVSYFADLDASTNLNSILTGDRYLKINGNLIKSGVLIQSTNTILNWSDGFHYFQGKPAGVFSFADGHAQFVRQEQLNFIMQNQPLATNRFCFP